MSFVPILESISHYSEAWGSEVAFRLHLQSEVFRRILAAMDMCCEEPQITIGNLSGRGGIAHMQELREKEDTLPAP